MLLSHNMLQGSIPLGVWSLENISKYIVITQLGHLLRPQWNRFRNCAHVAIDLMLLLFLCLFQSTKKRAEEIRFSYNNLQGTFPTKPLENLVNLGEFIAGFICALLGVTKNVSPIHYSSQSPQALIPVIIYSWLFSLIAITSRNIPYCKL